MPARAYDVARTTQTSSMTFQTTGGRSERQVAEGSLGWADLLAGKAGAPAFLSYRRAPVTVKRLLPKQGRGASGPLTTAGIPEKAASRGQPENRRITSVAVQRYLSGAATAFSSGHDCGTDAGNRNCVSESPGRGDAMSPRVKRRSGEAARRATRGQPKNLMIPQGNRTTPTGSHIKARRQAQRHAG
jgi:hypothetical protein